MSMEIAVFGPMIMPCAGTVPQVGRRTTSRASLAFEQPGAAVFTPQVPMLSVGYRQA